MKLISWNVNGIRACVQKGFLDYFKEQKADLFCIQETKCQEDQITLELDGYYQFWHSAVRKGYSGTAIFSKHKPLNVSFGFNGKEEDLEGRVLTLEFDKFYMVNVYTPNSQRDLARLPIRLKWEDDFKNYLNKLDEHKPVILCGDLNVAHNEIDLANPKSNRTNSGFTEEERGKMTALLESGFTDSFRFLNPTKEGSYSWWSYMAKVRERNIGWRIDYFIISNRLQNELINSEIHTHIMGSDHCPVVLTMEDSII